MAGGICTAYRGRGLLPSSVEVREGGIDPSIRDDGGRAAPWRQIISDVLGAPSPMPPQIAQRPRRRHRRWRGCRAMGMAGAAATGEASGEPVAAARYRALYEIFRDLYTHLRGDFAALARAQ
jgi:sugar (pentulose or hexulose) kinase